MRKEEKDITTHFDPVVFKKGSQESLNISYKNKVALLESLQCLFLHLGYLKGWTLLVLWSNPKGIFTCDNDCDNNKITVTLCSLTSIDRKAELHSNNLFIFFPKFTPLQGCYLKSCGCLIIFQCLESWCKMYWIISIAQLSIFIVSPHIFPAY